MAETMTNADNFWLCMDEPANLMVITAFMEFEEILDFKRLLATIECRLAYFPRFRKRVVRPKSGVGLPTWETDPNYDIRSHVQRITLPDPGDKADLQEMISNLSTTPLDPHRPLWQVHLIEGYNEGCILFFRVHHCIGDGIALIHVLLAAADTDPDAPWPTCKDASKRLSRPGLPFSVNALLDSVKQTVKSARKAGNAVIREMGKSASDPAHFTKLMGATGRLSSDITTVLAKHTVMRSDPNTPFKGRLGIRKRMAWTEPMALSKIKSVGRAISTATLNDVLIATVTGAMRRYLKTRNVAVNELDLRVTVPVNIRKPGTEFELGNKFSLVFLALPVYLEDPILRLKEVKRRMDYLKTSPDPYINFGLLSAMGFLPPGLAQKASQFFGNKASGVLTNVPGPRQPLYFAGSKINNLMFWVPRSGKVGLGISILSYDGKVTVGIASDEKLMPDPEILLEGFENEFNLLLDLVNSGKIDEQPLVLHDRFEENQAAAEDRPPEKPSAPEDSEPCQCKAVTQRGNSCRKTAMPGTDYCSVHRNAADEDILLKDVTQLMKELTDA